MQPTDPRHPEPSHNQYAREYRELRQSKSIEGIDPDEKLVCIIHRHVIGLVFLYLGAAITILVLIAAFGFLIPDIVGAESMATAQSLLVLVMMVVLTLVAIGLVIATYVYRASKLIITNRTVTQIIQTSLFNRNVSELSMANVEDVSADKRGILQHLFDYGTLRIQTAGELENFMFAYCPRPNYFGRLVLDAHHTYINELSDNN